LEPARTVASGVVPVDTQPVWFIVSRSCELSVLKPVFALHFHYVKDRFENHPKNSKVFDAPPEPNTLCGYD
jgi:hypothetical protein